MAEMDEENTAQDFTGPKRLLKRPRPDRVSCQTLFPKADACSWHVERSFESTGPGARRASALGHGPWSGGSASFLVVSIYGGLLPPINGTGCAKPSVLARCTVEVEETPFSPRLQLT